MSEYEHIKGRIKKIPRLEGESIDSYFQRATGCTDFNREYYDNLYDPIWDYNFEDEFIVLNGEIFKILEKHRIDEYSYCEIQQVANDEFSFSTCFYNGGASLSEVLEDEFKHGSVE